MRKTEFIIIIIYRVRTTANVAAMCAIVTIMIDRAVHIPVAVDMRTLLDSSSTSSDWVYYQKALIVRSVDRSEFYPKRFVAGSIPGSGRCKVRGVFNRGEIPRFLTEKMSIKIP